MAIAFDAAAGGNNGGVGGTFDFNGLTVSAGSDRALVVSVTDHVGASSNISSVTWDQGGTNQAMTKIGLTRFGASRAFTLWYLTAPTSGNKTLRIAQTGGEYILVSAACYTGVLQTGQPEANVDENGSPSPNSALIDVVTANSWLVMGASGESGNTTAGTGTTQRAGDGFGGNINAIMDSGGPVGIDEQSLEVTSSGDVAMNIIAIAPAVSSGTVTITTPARYKTLQRNGSNQASIAITGTYTGSPSAIEASFNGGSYATIDASPAGGNFSGTLSNQHAGQGTLTVRFTNDTGVTDTELDIGIGDVFLVGGDSRSEGRGTNPQSYSHGSLKATVFREDDAWADGDDPVDTNTTSGSHWPLLASLALADQAVPIAFITAGEGSTDVAGSANQWATGNSALTQLLAQASAAGTGANGYKGALFLLGPNAVVNATTISQATYNAAIDTLASDIAALTGSPKIMVDICGEVSTGSPPDRRAALNNIRAAIIEAAGNNANVLIGPNSIEQDYSDGVHPASDTDLQILADRFWVAIKNGFYGGALGRGPRFVAATLNPDKTVVTVFFDRDLAAGTNYSGFRVTDSGTPATISSTVRQSDRAVAITVSAPLSAVANALVSFGSNEDAKGQTVPTSTAVTLPDARTIVLPAEPFFDQPMTAPLFVLTRL